MPKLVRIENTDENLVKVRRFRYLIRRAHWLERRLALCFKGRSGYQFDEAEYKELLDIFKEIGLEYVPGTHDDDGNFIAPPEMSNTQATSDDPDEEPPHRPSEETWVPKDPTPKKVWWNRNNK